MYLRVFWRCSHFSLHCKAYEYIKDRTGTSTEILYCWIDCVGSTTNCYNKMISDNRFESNLVAENLVLLRNPTSHFPQSGDFRTNQNFKVIFEVHMRLNWPYRSRSNCSDHFVAIICHAPDCMYTVSRLHTVVIICEILQCKTIVCNKLTKRFAKFFLPPSMFVYITVTTVRVSVYNIKHYKYPLYMKLYFCTKTNILVHIVLKSDYLLINTCTVRVLYYLSVQL